MTLRSRTSVKASAAWASGSVWDTWGVSRPGGEPAHEDREVPALPRGIEAAQGADRESDRLGILDQQVIGLELGRTPAGEPDDEQPAEGGDAAHGFVGHGAAHGS